MGLNGVFTDLIPAGNSLKELQFGKALEDTVARAGATGLFEGAESAAGGGTFRSGFLSGAINGALNPVGSPPDFLSKLATKAAFALVVNSGIQIESSRISNQNYPMPTDAAAGMPDGTSGVGYTLLKNRHQAANDGDLMMAS